MEDDFLEEDDTIFGDDEVFDCIILEEMEKKTGKNNNAGCLSTIFMMFSTFGGFAMLIFWIRDII